MMSQQTGTNSTRRLPFADAGSFSGWLIQGLLRFNNAMLSTGWGEDNAFPGYTFSVENGIPQQFPEFFFDLCDDDAKRAVRDGLVLTLKRLRTRPEWLSLLLFDVIRIGLNVAPDLVASNAVAFLP